MARADKLPQRPPFVYLSPPFRFSLINAPLLNAFDGRPHHELDPPTSPLPCRLLLFLPRSIKGQRCATLQPLLLARSPSQSRAIPLLPALYTSPALYFFCFGVLFLVVFVVCFVWLLDDCFE